MFRLSLSYSQTLMIQIHINNVLCIVRSPTLTVSVANDNKMNNYENTYVVVVMLCNNVMFSLLFTLIVIPYRYCKRWGYHNA